jgi:abhydrolase domain-containing protein 17
MVKNLIQFILFSYTVLTLFAYIFADKIIFPAPKSSYKDFEGIIKLKTYDHKTISAVYLPNEQAKYTILFNHGNYEDLGTIMPLLKNLQLHGFAVFAYDYHGYGTSEGRASEQNAYYDVDTAYDYLTKELNVKPEEIVVFGFSVGSALALDLATRKPVAAVILQGLFLSAYRTITQIPFLPFDKFKNVVKIKKINVPILIIHGKKDSIVPFWQGRKLYAEANQPKYYYWVDNAGHNNLVAVSGDKYWQVIQDFITRLN